MTQRLAGKRALITGAARGIGEAIARAYVREGAEVIVTDIDGAALDRLATELGAQAMTLDIASEADWDAAAKAFPAIDILVNNAGITGFEHHARAQDPEHASLSDWRDVHRVNTDGTFLGCRYGIRAMREAGAGAIINISSRSGMVGIPGAAAYAASKAAIRNHTKSVALYCAEQGLDIRCNSIHPAAILTPMWEPMLGTGPEREANMAACVADTPARRFGQADEVAALAVMLGSDEARYMTGAELTIDGGLLAGTVNPPKRAD